MRLPSHVHEQRYWVFHRLEVAHVENPHAVETVVVCQRQLFPHVLRRGDVEPLGVARCAHIVNVIVESPAARVLAFLCCRHSAHIAPVVVAEQHNDVVGHFHSLVIIVEHLFIERPHLWGLVCRLARHFLYDAPLVLYDGLQQACVGILRHCLVAVAAHSDGHHVLGSLHAFYAVAEELVEILLVGGVVPCSVFFPVACILLMVACHWLVMAGAHDDTHLVCCAAVLRVVGIEGPTPHGRPHEVSAQTQYQFEHLGVETVVAVVGSPCVFHPRGEAWRLVVEEQSAVAHCRFAVGVGSFAHIYIIMVWRWDISPPVPGRHTYLARQFVNAVDGASAVASCYCNASVAGSLNDEFLEFSLQCLAVDDTLFDEFVNLLRVSYRSHDDACVSAGDDGCVGSCHSSEVLGKVSCGNHDTLLVLLVNENCRLAVASHLNVSVVE